MGLKRPPVARVRLVKLAGHIIQEGSDGLLAKLPAEELSCWRPTFLQRHREPFKGVGRHSESNTE